LRVHAGTALPKVVLFRPTIAAIEFDCKGFYAPGRS
jgi:hypothetical protein